MTRVGLLGCGNIGGIIAERSTAEIIAVYDMRPERAHNLAQRCGATAVDNLCEFLHSNFDVLVEAASVDAVRNYASAALEAGKDLEILSIGSLAALSVLSLLADLDEPLKIGT
jgi:aspartate dehydrogenase